MNQSEFFDLMRPVIDEVAGQTPSADMQDHLNAKFPAGGEVFQAIDKACRDGIAAGWMCAQGSEGRRFGRIIEATDESKDLSVDVVDLIDIVGPHHRHPNGEICLTMPVTETAKFDGNGAGWCVYPPGSAHNPTVTDGHAMVLYLLPGGAIEFTGQ